MGNIVCCTNTFLQQTLVLISLIRNGDVHVNPGSIKCHNTSLKTQPVISMASTDEQTVKM